MSKKLSCDIITHMFSFGNDTSRAELRVTELKALMRNTYRIAQQEMPACRLYQRECKLFGDAETQASPVRMRIIESIPHKEDKKKLLYHKETRKYKEYCRETGIREGPNPLTYCIPAGTTFDISITLTKSSVQDMDWYTDLAVLSLMLGGMGKRSRRARGCVAVIDYNNFSKEAVIGWIRDKLNKLNEMDEHFTYVSNNNEINIQRKGKETDKQKVFRPVIEKIIFGEVFKVENAECFLTHVDWASHYIKKTRVKDGRFATGCGHNRFASSVIVSLIKIEENKLLPVFTCVKAVLKNKSPLDISYTERDAFINDIRERSKKI